MSAFYNEIDPFAVAWLRELIKCGHIADGIVDSRPIQEIEPSDLEGFTQVHFFAGIGGWSYALRLAGWPDDFPVWTGSCPCQPFSTAGKRKGFNDDRHLWPFFCNLIVQSRPAIIFGEQVASPDGFAWLDTVSLDLEDSAYATAAADLCAAGIGAPHIRQRLYWVGYAEGAARRLPVRECGSFGDQSESGGTGEIGKLGHHHHQRQQGRDSAELRECTDQLVAGPTSPFSAVVNAESEQERLSGCSRFARGTTTAGFWSPADWIFCRDNKYRPVEPGTFPLAHGVPARVGRLRGYGNAIVPEVAATFIQAFVEASGLI